jgi:hypothetical protein
VQNLRRHVHVQQICTCADLLHMCADLHMAGASYLAKEHSKRVKDVQYVHKTISFRTGMKLSHRLRRVSRP